MPQMDAADHTCCGVTGCGYFQGKIPSQDIFFMPQQGDDGGCGACSIRGGQTRARLGHGNGSYVFPFASGKDQAKFFPHTRVAQTQEKACGYRAEFLHVGLTFLCLG